MDVVVERCAGLDALRDNVVATVRFPSEDRRWEVVTQTFRTTLAGLAELAAWLAGVRGHAGGDGFHPRVMEGRLLRAGGAVLSAGS